MLPSLRTEHLIAAMIPMTYLVMVGVEQCGTGRRWPRVRGWQLAGAVGFLMLGVINNLGGWVLAWALDEVRLFDGRALGTVGGALVGYGLLSLTNAGLHRAYHRSDFLWRWVHQLHHAPPRLDVAGVMVQTPFEALANAVLFSLVTGFVLRLDPVATMGCAYLGAFYGMFQHFNIRTPRWLGYFIQRPEAHCAHHRRGVHAGNYSDLPVWDMLWGSFENPRDFHGELGFEPVAARQVLAMLCGRDVNLAEAGHDEVKRAAGRAGPRESAGDAAPAADAAGRA